MSNLRKQVVKPQGNNTRSGYYSKCDCGAIKNYFAERCLKCKMEFVRTAVSNEEFIDSNGVLCRRIPLTRGQYVIVNAWKYKELMEHRWLAHWSEGMKSYYAYGYYKNNLGKWTGFAMHRFILGIEDPKIFVDHKDKNTLNNTIDNLRKSTPTENQRNTKIRTDNSSGYMGVHFVKTRGTWVGRVSVDRKRIGSRHCKTAKEAALERDALARKHYGKFAVLNFPEH